MKNIIKPRYIVAVWLFFFVFGMVGYGQVWKKLKEAVKEELKEEAKEFAEEKAVEAKDSAITRVQNWANDYDPTELNYAVSFSDNSGFYESEDKYEKYKRSMVSFAVSDGSINEKLADRVGEMDEEDYNNAGELFYASNRFRSAENSFKAALLILDKKGKNRSETAARVKSNLGLLYHTTGRFTMSEEFTLEALKLRRDVLKDKQGLGASLNNLGVLNKDRGKYNLAEENLAEAISITREVPGESSSEYAIVLNNIAILYQELGKYDAAAEKLKESISIAENGLKKKSANFVRLKVNSKDMISYKESRDEKRESNKEAVLMGDPDYDMGFDWDQMKQMPLPELPGTKVEVEKVNEQLVSAGWKTNSWFQQDATEDRIKQISGPAVLHIATHGFFLEDIDLGAGEKVFGIEPVKAAENPLLRSGLMFAGADNTVQSIDTKESSDKNDGVLNAYEAMMLDLDHTQLVILSACETGLGEIRNGEGVYGLQRAFQIAGTSTVVISLWQVSDEVTQKLMTGFYKNWLISGDKQKAFTQAQLSIKEKYPEPFYWGAFVMVSR